MRLAPPTNRRRIIEMVAIQSGMTFLRIVIPALSFCLSMISGQTLRVCLEGKPVLFRIML